MSSGNVASLLKMRLVDVPWPIRVDDETIEGRLGQNKICTTKCHEKTCWYTASSIIGTVCPLGLTVYETSIGREKVKVIGVVGPSFKDKVPKHNEYKEACKGRSVSAEAVQSWVGEVKEFLDAIDTQQKEALAIALEPLHDAMRLARDVSQLAERTIGEQAGGTHAERFENASESHKSLVKSANLLVDTFDLLEVYLNPEAAKFGQLRSVEIYKLLDKLCKIASNARASQSRPRVVLHGNTRRSYDVYETFKLIPFCLLDNAQKYSRDGADVKVQISEQPTSVLIEIKSQGPLIPKADQKKIFERRFRGEAAVQAHPSGMGVGLYVSDIVAQAHNMKIQVTSIGTGFQVGGIDQAVNTFSFELRPLAR